MRAEFERAAREGAPRPESHAIRAHVPAVFWSFANAWNDTFVQGVCDHAIKELCRLYVSQAVNCNYCGNQRSLKAQAQGLVEDDVIALLDFDKAAAFRGLEDRFQRRNVGDHLFLRHRIGRTPFGGVRDSGLGIKEGVTEAMKFFTHVKTFSLPW